MTAYKQGTVIKELLRRIRENVYTEKLPSANKLACEFNVNVKTANKALNSLVGKGIAYRENGKGTFLKDSNSQSKDRYLEIIYLGVIDFYSNPYFSAIWRGINKALQKTSYRTVVKVLEEDRKKGGQKEIYRDFSEAEGRLIIGTANEKQIAELKKDGAPFVMVGTKTKYPNVLSVYANTEKAAFDAVSAIISTQRRQIAFIGATTGKDRQVDVDKFHGYMEALLVNNIEPDFKLIENTPAFPDAGYSAMKRILSQQTPDAVFVAHDHLCPGAYKAIEEAGLTIPDDIGVLGCNGIELMLVPSLSTVYLPLEEVGQQSALLLLEEIEAPNKQKAFQIILEGKLELKDSINKKRIAL